MKDGGAKVSASSERKNIELIQKHSTHTRPTTHSTKKRLAFMYRVNNSKHPGIFVLFVGRIIHKVNAYEDPRAHKREGAKSENEHKK